MKNKFWLVDCQDSQIEYGIIETDATLKQLERFLAKYKKWRDYDLDDFLEHLKKEFKIRFIDLQGIDGTLRF